MTYKSTAQGVAVTSMSVLHGLRHHANWEKLQPVWEGEGMGFIEFLLYVADVADISEKWLENHGIEDFPGVYDYEVSHYVGETLLEFMLEQNALPSLDEVGRWIDEKASEFFGLPGMEELP